MHKLIYINYEISCTPSVSHAENIHRLKKNIELWHIFVPITNNFPTVPAFMSRSALL